MIKIVASIKDCGTKRTKQFSTSKNRKITLEELNKLEEWVRISTRSGYLVEINYKITFDDNEIDRRYNHTITGVGCKTYVRHEERVRYIIEETIKDINRQVRSDLR